MLRCLSQLSRWYVRFLPAKVIVNRHDLVLTRSRFSCRFVVRALPDLGRRHVDRIPVRRILRSFGESIPLNRSATRAFGFRCGPEPERQLGTSRTEPPAAATPPRGSMIVDMRLSLSFADSHTAVVIVPFKGRPSRSVDRRQPATAAPGTDGPDASTRPFFSHRCSALRRARPGATRGASCDSSGPHRTGRRLWHVFRPRVAAGRPSSADAERRRHHGNHRHWVSRRPGYAATPMKELEGQLGIFVKPLVAAGYTVFVINHRGAPAFKYPAGIEMPNARSGSSVTTPLGSGFHPIASAPWVRRPAGTWCRCSASAQARQPGRWRCRQPPAGPRPGRRRVLPSRRSNRCVQ